MSANKSTEWTTAGTKSGTSAMVSVMQRMNTAQEMLESENPLLPPQKKALQKLKELHVDHLRLESEYRKDWNELKLKYFKMMEPLYQARAETLQSKTAADANSPSTDAPVPSEAGDSKTNSTATTTEDLNAVAASNVPNFWLKALKHNSTFSRTIELHDEPILKYLKNVRSEWLDEKEQLSYRISMDFAENPFFTNTVLTKFFELEDEPESEESVLTKTVGTEIKWKPGKNVMKKLVVKRQRNKRTGEFRLVKAEKDRESFFHFFSSNEVPEDDTLEAMKESDVQELENTLEIEYEMGCILRNRIIPHAVGWYLNIEVETDDDEDDDDDEDGEDEDDEDESGEDNSEEEDVVVESDEDASKRVAK